MIGMMKKSYVKLLGKNNREANVQSKKNSVSNGEEQWKKEEEREKEREFQDWFQWKMVCLITF